MIDIKKHNEALALLEIEGIARALLAHDEALKKAPIDVIACTPITPGKIIFIFSGPVENVKESFHIAKKICGSRLLDKLFLPLVHRDVIIALSGERIFRKNESLGVLEFKNVASSLEAADATLKSANIKLGRLHAASGFGGKSFFTLLGDLADVEAGVEIATLIGGDRLLDKEIIPAPHDELEDTIFKRPWPLDPSNI